MPNYLAPGVYFEEYLPASLSLESSVDRPLEGSVKPLRASRSRWRNLNSTAVFIGFAKAGPFNVPTYLSSWNQFENYFGTRVDGTYLALSVEGYFRNGGSGCFVIRVGEHPEPTRSAQAPLPASDGAGDAYLITASFSGPIGNEIEIDIGPSRKLPDAATHFSLAVRVAGELRELFDDLATDGPQPPEGLVNTVSTTITLKPIRPSVPQYGTFRLTGYPEGSLDSGSAAGLAGFEDFRESIGTIESVGKQADFLCAPDLMALFQGGVISLDQVIALQLELIASSQTWHTLIAVLDPPPGLSPPEMTKCRLDTMGFDSSNAVLYYPWVKVLDPMNGHNEFIPPCGYIAGMIARVSNTVGPQQSPTHEVLVGVLGTEVPLLKHELDMLTPIGINAITAPTEEKALVLSGRTLSSDPPKRNLSSKRAADLIAVNLAEQMQWVLHEPYGPGLWEQVTFELNTFLELAFRAGVLGGADPEHAYMVRCDNSTNPPGTTEAGRMTAEVGANLADGSTFTAAVVFYKG